MMSFAVVTVVKATVVCGAALLLSRLCRRTRASIRHAMFVLTFAALVVVPSIGTVIPMIPVTVPILATAEPSPAENAPKGVPRGTAGQTSGIAAPSVVQLPARTSSISIAELIAAAWLIGVVTFLMPIVVGFWQVRRLRQAASPWITVHEHVQTRALRLGVTRGIAVLIHEGATGPMACGVLKPTIILPASAQQWNEETLTCVLEHELEHVARWDFLTQRLSRAVCAAYWFHPLVWAAWRRLRLEAERACDDAVLREAGADEYASLLVSIAQRGSASTPLIAMAGRGDLAARVAAVLDQRQSRGRVGHRRLIGLIVSAAIAMIGLAPITIAGATQTSTTTRSAAPALTFETASLKRHDGVDIKTTMMYFSGDPAGRPGVGPDGLFHLVVATNVTARQLLWFAFRQLKEGRANIGPDLVDTANVPGWVDSDRFDVVAKAPSRATPPQLQEMLQSLLIERFKLKTHRGSMEVPIYAVALVSQGIPGPGLTPSQIDCRSNTGEPSPCGLSGRAGRLMGRGVTMAGFVTRLAEHLHASSRIRVDRPLVVRSGLSEPFDFTLEWTPDSVARDVLSPSQTAAGVPNLADVSLSNAVNFVAALEQQLGLQLVPAFATEPALIVDVIELPALD
jgi:uncharacterized protein (TIGR03435 family)